MVQIGVSPSGKASDSDSDIRPAKELKNHRNIEYQYLRGIDTLFLYLKRHRIRLVKNTESDAPFIR